MPVFSGGLLTPGHLTPGHLTPGHLTPGHLTPGHLTMCVLAIGISLTIGPTWAQDTNANDRWQPLDGGLIASLLVRRTLVVQGGRQVYLLSSGSAYQEASGYLSYQRWGVLGNRLCIQDRQRYCYTVARAPSGWLRITDSAQRVGYARLLDGDPNRLVWRYGLSLRTALQEGQVR